MGNCMFPQRHLVQTAPSAEDTHVLRSEDNIISCLLATDFKLKDMILKIQDSLKGAWLPEPYALY